MPSWRRPELIRHPQARSRWSQQLQQLPPWLLTLLVVAILVGCWALVRAAGGSRTAFPHLFYVPIVLAALPFGIRGGVLAGMAATVLAGPLMPLDVASGEAQELVNWLARGGFFVAIGAVSGSSTRALRHSFEAGLSEQLWVDVELDEAGDEPDDDPFWAERIRHTLDHRTFHTVFQPIYGLDSGRIVAVEALTRFEDEPTSPPDVWFEQAHRTGLGLELELATLAAAFEVSRGRPDDMALSFNASPELLSDARLLSLMHTVDGTNLIVEVTEHDVIDDYQHVSRALGMLRGLGVQVAIDDAGAGFASFRHIVRLRPDLIKLDPSLTQNLSCDPVRRALADALLQFAERTDSRIIVEGIESASDLAAWRDLGAHAAQGYLLGRPGPLPFAPTFRPLARVR